jgi:hypothetical protein
MKVKIREKSETVSFISDTNSIFNSVKLKITEKNKYVVLYANIDLPTAPPFETNFLWIGHVE